MTTKERNTLIRKIAHAVRNNLLKKTSREDHRYVPTVTQFKTVAKRRSDNQLLIDAMKWLN